MCQTKVVAMIVPADVKACVKADRKIEFVVDGVKYSAVLPEGLKAGDTFRARIPATPIMLPVVGPAAGESAPNSSTRRGGVWASLSVPRLCRPRHYGGPFRSPGRRRDPPDPDANWHDGALRRHATRVEGDESPCRRRAQQHGAH